MQEGQKTGSDDPEALTTYHVRRALSCEKDSLDWLVDRFGPLLAAQARYRLGPELSERVGVADLIADAWLAVLPKLDRVRPRDGRYTPVLLSYLSSAVRLEANNRLRAIMRRQFRESAHGEDGALEHPLHTLGSGLREAVSQLSLRETARIIADQIRGLCEEDRTVILLRGVEGLGYEAIAAETREDPASLRQRYRRALARLRKALPASVLEEVVDD